MSDRVPPARVPDDVLQTYQETTPPACGPHCHQAALIESLGEWLQRRAETEDGRHRELLAAVSEVRGGLRAVQDQVVRISLSQTEFVTAEATQKLRALKPPDSDPPPSLLPKRGKLTAGLRTAVYVGLSIGTAAVTVLGWLLTQQ